MQLANWPFSGPPPPASPLLSLPAELRALIFQYAVTTPSDNPVVTYRLGTYERDGYSEAVQPPLTCVSRQLRRESLPLFYECNDFVLHSEAPRASDTRAWLRSSAPYLRDLRCLSIWIRYVALTHNRTAPSGAICVTLRRPRKSDAWAVREAWEWITVCRKPADVSEDGKLLIASLEALIGRYLKEEDAGAENYSSVVTDLRNRYVHEKMSS